ncbi:MAG TPA: hypothetical protein VKV19_04580 [Ktedonobacteraceae bacterium]|nr:hypothetical protein [Ktedonobacteraceae bacterium]
MDSLVQRLCQGTHPVSLTHPSHSASDLEYRILVLHSVYITFTDTAGGTQLFVTLDPQATSLHEADFEQNRGSVHLEGNLRLNFTAVRCIADIDLATLQGRGHLSLREEPEY